MSGSYKAISVSWANTLPSTRLDVCFARGHQLIMCARTAMAPDLLRLRDRSNRRDRGRIHATNETEFNGAGASRTYISLVRIGSDDAAYDGTSR
jgi:hypothetical protein